MLVWTLVSISSKHTNTNALCRVFKEVLGVSGPQFTDQYDHHTVSLSAFHRLCISVSRDLFTPMSSSVRSEKLSAGHSLDVFALQWSLTLHVDQPVDDFPIYPLHRYVEGAQIQKSRSPFFLDASFCAMLRLENIILPRKPQLSLCTIWLKHLRSSEGWQTAGKKRRMFHSSISRELLCLPVWAYYSMVGEA